jgi:hypothetical protein
MNNLSKKHSIEALIRLEIQVLRQQTKHNTAETKEKLKKIREMQEEVLNNRK